MVTAVDEVDFIADCMNSIYTSALGISYEVLVVVSGDNQEIRDILKSYPSARLIDHELTGEPGTPRNAALSQAKGEWIAFIDADDVFGTYALARRLEACLLNRDTHDFVGVAFSSERFTMQPSRWINQLRSISGLRHTDVDRGFSCNSFSPVLGSMYRRSLLEKIGGFPESGEAEDLYLLLRFAQNNLHMLTSNDTDSGYRQLKSSRHSREDLDVLKALLKFEDEIIAIRSRRMLARARIHRGIPHVIRKTYPDVPAFIKGIQLVGVEYLDFVETESIEKFVKTGLQSVYTGDEIDDEVSNYMQILHECKGVK